MIVDKCPNCQKEHKYDLSQDTYIDTFDEAEHIHDKTVTLHLCKNCKVVVGVTVEDNEYGSALYTICQRII